MKTVALGEVTRVVSGATPKTSVAEYWGGEVNWATPADLSALSGAYIADTPRKLTDAGVKSCATILLPAGSVLLSSRAPIGHVAINTVPMATNQGFKSLVPGLEIDAKYLYHWLKSETKYIQSLGNGATFKELSKKTTENIRVPLPSFDEQRRIAAILDHADALRAKRRQVLAHLDVLTQSVFHDMFDDVATIPLGEVASFYSGGTPSKLNEAHWSGSTPWFSAKDLKQPDLYDSQDHVSESVPLETRLRLLPAGTIALVVRGMILAHTLPVSVLRVPATINQDLKAVLPRKTTDTDFLASALRARASWSLARVSTAAHGTKKLETSVLESIPIPSVKLTDQQEFSKRVASIRAQSNQVKRAIYVEDELFASLQSRAF